MSDWVHDDQLKTGFLLWIVDGCDDLSAGTHGLMHNLSLLVPETIPNLKKNVYYSTVIISKELFEGWFRNSVFIE